MTIWPGKITSVSMARWRAAVPLAAAVLAAAACSSTASTTPAQTSTAGTSPAQTSPAAAATSPSPGAAAAALAAGTSKFGGIITGAGGRSVYLFEKDKGTTSSCYGACAAAWPPVLVTGTPVAGTGVNSSLLGTAKRTDGSTQLTYGGFLLYYFTGDSKPGDVSGEGSQAFGAGWDLVSPAGKKIEKSGS